MLLERFIKGIKACFEDLNREFFLRSVEWSILDSYHNDAELVLSIQVNKRGSLCSKKYAISEWSSDSCRLRVNHDEPQIVLKEEIAKKIAIDSYGGQIPGTSLMLEEPWMEHLNTIAAT